MLKRVVISVMAVSLYVAYGAAKAEPPSTTHIVLEDWTREAARNSAEPAGAGYDRAIALVFREAVTDCIALAKTSEMPFKWLGRVNESGEVVFSLISANSEYAQCFQTYMRDAKLPEPPTMTPAFMAYGSWAVTYDSAEHADAIPALRSEVK